MGRSFYISTEKKRVGSRTIIVWVCGVMGDRLRWISDMLGLGFIKYKRLGTSPSPLSSVIYGQMVERNSKLGTLSFLCLDSERFKDHWRSLETKLQIQQEEGGICGKLGKSPALFQCVTQRKGQLRHVLCI